WAEESQFGAVIDELYGMRGKAVERLAGKVGTAKLQTVIELLARILVFHVDKRPFVDSGESRPAGFYGRIRIMRKSTRVAPKKRRGAARRRARILIWPRACRLP